jgi:DNA polymerase-1
LNKLKSTYIDALPRLVDAKTGRVHCSFNQTGAETGRLSSNRPNLQNIPVRTEMGREIRKAFIPSKKDHVLLSADYSQIELRVLAHLADEPNLKRAFEKGEDIHTYTAGLMFDVPPEKVTSEMRYSAKRINFGITYGMGSFGLAKDLGVSQKEAQAFIDTYFARYPGIRKFMDGQIEKARERGYAETLLGRRRYLPDITSKNPAVRQFAERQAVNTPAQGTAADLIKAAMVKVEKALVASGSAAKMIITVHDELVFDVPKAEVADVAKLVTKAMETAAHLTVPLEVTVKSGANWAEMRGL